MTLTPAAYISVEPTNFVFPQLAINSSAGKGKIPMRPMIAARGGNTVSIGGSDGNANHPVDTRSPERLYAINVRSLHIK